MSAPPIFSTPPTRRSIELERESLTVTTEKYREVCVAYKKQKTENLVLKKGLLEEKDKAFRATSLCFSRGGE